MGLFIGIDGGGTGCRAAVADATGRILGHAQGGPANIATDESGARAALITVARAALANAVGTGAEAALRTARAGLGLAGANAAGVSARLAAALPFTAARIETDAIAAALGALGSHDGILAAIGTGSVFVRQQSGRLQQFGGWGPVLGDEGSGRQLGRRALSRALLAHEGRAGMTPFLADLIHRHGGAEGVIAFSLTARPADLAALAPEILASEDPAARALWAENVSDIAETLASLQPDPPLPVTFTGGLGPACAAALTQFPQRPALGTALDGALILARGAA
jgi:glucosamine kinase